MPLIEAVADEVLVLVMAAVAAATICFPICSCFSGLLCCGAVATCLGCADRHGVDNAENAQPAATPLGYAGAATGDDCPICLQQPTNPCITSCNHEFCTDCLLQYWRAQYAPQPVRCPYCRGDVVLLLPAGDTPQHPEATEQLREYNAQVGPEQARRMGEWGHLGTALRFTVGMLGRALQNPGTLRQIASVFISARRLCVLFGALVYTVLPVDLIPEALFGVFGLLDDFLVWVGVAVMVALAFHQQVINQAQRAHA